MYICIGWATPPFLRTKNPKTNQLVQKTTIQKTNQLVQKTTIQKTTIQKYPSTKHPSLTHYIYTHHPSRGTSSCMPLTVVPPYFHRVWGPGGSKDISQSGPLALLPLTSRPVTPYPPTSSDKPLTGPVFYGTLTPTESQYTPLGSGLPYYF